MFILQGRNQRCGRHPLQILEAQRRLHATGEANNARPSLHPSDFLQSERACNNGLLEDRVISTEIETPILPYSDPAANTDCRIEPTTDTGIQHDAECAMNAFRPWKRQHVGRHILVRLHSRQGRRFECGVARWSLSSTTAIPKTLARPSGRFVLATMDLQYQRGCYVPMLES